jgi:hypothetical protein
MKIVEINKNRFPSIVKSVGVEIECGIFKRNLYNIIDTFDFVKIGEDGSVCVDCPVNEDDDSYDVWKENVEIRYWSDNLDDLLKFLSYCWNNAGIIQNNTCGNHVHVCFRNFVPFWFSPFPYYFLKMYKRKYAKNRKYMLRLGNDYCKSYKYSNEIIGRMLSGNCDSRERYKFVNYLAYPKHGTIEFRVMPYAECYNEHKEQLLFILDVIEKWSKKSRKLYEEETPLPGQEYIQEVDEIIMEEGGSKDEIQIVF